MRENADTSSDPLQIAVDWGATNNTCLFLTVLEAEGSKTKALEDLGAGKDLFPTPVVFTVILQGLRGEHAPLGLHYKSSNPLTRALSA